MTIRKRSIPKSPSSYNPELGYVIDGDLRKLGRHDHSVNFNSNFDFCPRCKKTVELHEKPNLYNPRKTVKECRECSLIRGSVIWKDYEMKRRGEDKR